ncbi:MAG TPA: peptidoglycan-binding domain-containing protein [Arenibaculum sp.]|nr:peptidoglycan-binding domain-containing protein [Arenibaculum sp.]
MAKGSIVARMRRRAVTGAGVLVLWTGSAFAACPEFAATPGERYAIVEGVQRQLALAGFDPGGFDGVLGEATRDAIRRYQRTAGLASTGCPGRDLLDRMSFGLPKVHSFDRPAVPSVVLEVQEELTRRSYYLGAVDGIAGWRTRQAIRDFQRDAGLPVTGDPGHGLLQELRSNRAVRAR